MNQSKKRQEITFEGQVSEIELVYKSKVKAADRARITGVADTVKLFRNGWNKNTLQLQEQAKVLYLNRSYRVLGVYPLSTGSITGTVVDCQLIMTAALLVAAKFVVICHNHPSGDSRPSKADIKLTTQIKKAADLMNIILLDHIILTAEDSFSFANEGMLGEK